MRSGWEAENDRHHMTQVLLTDSLAVSSWIERQKDRNCRSGRQGKSAGVISRSLTNHLSHGHWSGIYRSDKNQMVARLIEKFCDFKSDYFSGLSLIWHCRPPIPFQSDLRVFAATGVEIELLQICITFAICNLQPTQEENSQSDVESDLQKWCQKLTSWSEKLPPVVELAGNRFSW